MGCLILEYCSRDDNTKYRCNCLVDYWHKASFLASYCHLPGCKRGQLTATLNAIFSLTYYSELHIPTYSYY